MRLSSLQISVCGTSLICPSTFHREEEKGRGEEENRIEEEEKRKVEKKRRSKEKSSRQEENRREEDAERNARSLRCTFGVPIKCPSDHGTEPNRTQPNTKGPGNCLPRLARLCASDKPMNTYQFLDAAGKGDLAKVEKGLSQGIDVNVANADGNTAVHKAATSGSIHLLEFLLSKKADINKRNVNNSHPVQWAAYGGHLQAVKWFQSHGTNVTELNSSGHSCLFFAALNDHLEIVKYLQQFDVDIHHKSKEGLTPVLAAGSLGHLATVDFLLQQGCDPFVIGEYGKSLFKYLEGKRKREDVLKVYSKARSSLRDILVNETRLAGVHGVCDIVVSYLFSRDPSNTPV